MTNTSCCSQVLVALLFTTTGLACNTGCGGAPRYGESARVVTGGQSAPADGSGAYTAQPETHAMERPGLGTAWGESRQSPARTEHFVRSDGDNPFAARTLWYNDFQGLQAMNRWDGELSWNRGQATTYGGAIGVSLRDESGRPFPTALIDGRHFVIGEEGAHYAIWIDNQTDRRIECVASVDGLDVIDGKQGSYSKRGYLIPGNDSLRIDGFRRSADEVASFHFGAVRESYSRRSGQGDRNVGVVGVACFREWSTDRWWLQDEAQRRRNADPFPDRYAQPPAY